MISQTQGKSPACYHPSSNRNCQKRRKLVPRMTSSQIREKISNNRRGKANDQRRKMIKKIIQNKFNSYIKQEIAEQQVTCSICYDIMVGPTLTECGHHFCLPCIENSFFYNQQCPLCRNILENQCFRTSKTIQTMISHVLCHKASKEINEDYAKRVKKFQQAQMRRDIKSDIFLQIGKKIDLNFQNKWIQAEIIDYLENLLVLKFIHKITKKEMSLTKNINSRRLARHHAFTKQASLKPILYTKDMRLESQTYQYIVEDFSYRMPVQFVTQINVQPQVNIERTGSRWDELGQVENQNYWGFNESEMSPISGNFWNLEIEDIEIPFLQF